MSKTNDEALIIYKTMREQVKDELVTKTKSIRNLIDLLLLSFNILAVLYLNYSLINIYVHHPADTVNSLYYLNNIMSYIVFVGFSWFGILCLSGLNSSLIYQSTNRSKILVDGFPNKYKLIEAIVNIVLLKEMRWKIILIIFILLPPFIITIYIFKPIVNITILLLFVYLIFCINIFNIFKFYFLSFIILVLGKFKDIAVMIVSGCFVILVSFLAPGIFTLEMTSRLQKSESLLISLFKTPLLEPYVAMKTPITILIILSVISIFHLIIINILLMLCRVLFDRYYKSNVISQIN